MTDIKKPVDPLEGLFDENNVPESNFFKFSKVGDRVGGELVAIDDRPGRDVFGPQRVFTLKNVDGSLIKVGIPLSKDYVISRAATAALGDYLGFAFKAEIPNKTKGFHAAKSIEVYVKKVVKEVQE